MKRTIVEIDESLCDGCGACIPGCAEGALRLVDGKARLVSDRFCDGLGACVGHCPRGAIKIVERDAEPFDERAMVNGSHPSPAEACPGSKVEYTTPSPSEDFGANITSQLKHWPIQLHLVPVNAPFFQGADLLISASCVRSPMPISTGACWPAGP